MFYQISRRYLKSKSKAKSRKELTATVMLTSLVDAFSILVIYLLVSFSTAGELLYISKGMKLPTAHHVAKLEHNIVVKVENDKFYVDQEEVPLDHLVKKLFEMRKNWEKYYPGTDFTGAITIQADRRQTYDLLSQVIQAGGQTGYSDINFAVIRN